MVIGGGVVGWKRGKKEETGSGGGEEGMSQILIDFLGAGVGWAVRENVSGSSSSQQHRPQAAAASKENFSTTAGQ